MPLGMPETGSKFSDEVSTISLFKIIIIIIREMPVISALVHSDLNLGKSLNLKIKSFTFSSTLDTIHCKS